MDGILCQTIILFVLVTMEEVLLATEIPAVHWSASQVSTQNTLYWLGLHHGHQQNAKQEPQLDMHQFHMPEAGFDELPMFKC